MESVDAAPDDYLLERLQHAFAADPRLGELELEVRADGDRIVVSGCVQTEERKRAVTEITREIAPDRPVRNEIRVLSHGTQGMEHPLP
jgi:hypothetical protein